MASCSHCDTTILFGGEVRGEERFCNEQCLQAHELSTAAARVPESAVSDALRELRTGACPACGKTGSVVEHRTSHRAISYLIATSWSSPSQLACRSCHVKSVVGNSALTLLVGWWGFPWGLVMTPVQLFRNLGELMRSDGPAPSDKMRSAVRLMLASSGEPHPE